MRGLRARIFHHHHPAFSLSSRRGGRGGQFYRMRSARSRLIPRGTSEESPLVGIKMSSIRSTILRWHRAKRFDGRVPDPPHIIRHGKSRQVCARNELDRLTFIAMNRLPTVVRAHKHRQFVHVLEIIAGMTKGGQPVQPAAPIPGFLFELTAGPLFGGLSFVAMSAREDPLPGRVQSRFIIAQL